MKIKVFSKILFLVLLAFTVNSFVYFSFGNIYSSSVLNYTDFQDQFHSGIYQYRILSGYFLIFIYDVLSSSNIDDQIFKLKFFSPEAEPKMYLSFFILNTFFLMLSAIVMVLITETKGFIATNSEKLLLISVAIFVIAISQFVIVPYDVSSYFFLLLFFYLLLIYLKETTFLNLAFLAITLIISTFNRESSALSLSLAATVLYAKFSLSKKMFVPLLILIISFVIVYLGIRFISGNFSTNDGNLLQENLSQSKNLLGILFWMVFFIFPLILATDKKAIRLIIIFHILSLPYIIMCFYTGILYEVRLYVPLFLSSVILSRTQLSRIR